MKTIAILLWTLSIGAGIVVGSLEHRSARGTSPSSSWREESPSAVSLPPPPPPAAAGRKKRSYKPGDLDLVQVEEPSTVPEAETPKAEPRSVPLPPAVAAGLDPDLRARLDAVARLLDQEDFTAAEKAAGELAAGAPPAREAAERLAAAARVYRLVAGRQPQAAAGGSAFEVLLANGLKVMARQAQEGPDGYVFQLMKGAVFTAPREDVLEVRKLETGGETAPAWEALEPRIARLTHPIDIFVDGVERCLQAGHRKEAFRLLAGLLARADSDKLPLLFFPDAGEAFARDWKVAGGRAPAGSASVAAASEAAPSEAGDAKRSSADPAAPPAEAAGGEPDPQSLAEAERLVGEARALLRAVVGKDARPGDLQAVRERLDRVIALLDPLPPQHDGVKKIRREVGQLLSDASRTVPF